MGGGLNPSGEVPRFFSAGVYRYSGEGVLTAELHRSPSLTAEKFKFSFFVQLGCNSLVNMYIFWPYGVYSSHFQGLKTPTLCLAYCTHENLTSGNTPGGGDVPQYPRGGVA